MKKEMEAGLWVQNVMKTLTHTCAHAHTHQFSVTDSISSLLVSKINHMYNKVLTFIYSMLAQRISC